jgi:hypothetical protein
MYREHFYFVDLRFAAAGAPIAARRTRILLMNQRARQPVTFVIKGSPYLCSQSTDVENSIPLHVDIPRIGIRGSDLPFQTVLQEYLQFPYEHFLVVFLPFGSYCCKLCLSNNPRRKSQGLRWGEHGQIPLQIIPSLKTLDKACIDIGAVWPVAESVC